MFKNLDIRKLAKDSLLWSIEINLIMGFVYWFLGDRPMNEIMRLLPFELVVGFVVFFIFDGAFLAYKGHKESKKPVIREITEEEQKEATEGK